MKYFISVFMGVACVCALAFIYYYKQGRIPPSYIPWAAIELYGEPGLFTSYKLNKLKGDFAACQAALDRAGIDYEPIPDRTAGSCELTDQVSLQQSLYPYSAPVQGKCAVTAALIGWEKNVVQPLADQYFESDVASITHYGMFSCRNIAGSNRRSQHATANAIDIAAFRLNNGQTISILNDWDDEGAKGEFLRAVRDGGCQYFKTVLGPDYNAAHANHFHMDMGRFSICR